MRTLKIAGVSVSVGMLLASCGSDATTEPDATLPVTSASPTVSSAASTTSQPASTIMPPGDLSIEAFADISDSPVSDEMAHDLQAALSEMSELSDGVGMSATVLSPAGTWSGTVGTADGVRDLSVDDQFAIASGTKPFVAAQIMQMVETGLLELDDPATDHLPPDFAFDTNGATIRNLLSQRSGLPDYEPSFLVKAEEDRTHRWTTEELLALVPAHRDPVDRWDEYSSTNYLLLGMVIEHVTGRPLSAALRDGVLSIDGVERVVYQPDEAPTEPMAMPYGESTEAAERGGGYLPSLAHASGGAGAWGIASDSPSLAHWWRALCSGEIVTQESLTQMTPEHDEYGFGVIRFPVSSPALGHPGVEVGYISWSACLPEDGTVIVVLTNGDVNDLFRLGEPLMAAAADSTEDATP